MFGLYDKGGGGFITNARKAANNITLDVKRYGEFAELETELGKCDIVITHILDCDWEEAFALPRDFEREMSPQCLFDLPPLSRCDEHTKQWLRSLVHSLWLTRYPVRQWVADVTACAEEVDATYNQLQEALQKCADIQSASALQPCREQFVAFRRQCQNLGEAIAKFPSEVRVT